MTAFTLPLNNPVNAKSPKVAILLCTYNGANYLAEQLDSFYRQTHANWQVWASDDGSSDDTRQILQDYQAKWGENRLQVVDGPRAGSTKNFMSQLTNPAIQADYYAFSDQDDIWEADKIERAVAWLQTQSPDTPALYCTRTRFVDENNQELGLSQHFKRPPSFPNALMQNIAGGNTMVFNQAARALAANLKLDPVIHDWWLYLVVTASGGAVQYDPYPSLRYRQHADNLIGMNSSLAARWVRIRKLFKGDFKAWTDKNIECLKAIEPALTAQNRELLLRFEYARRQNALRRLALFRNLGLYRQTTLGDLGIVAASLFNKV